MKRNKPLVLRSARNIRRTLVGAALFGWIIYLGWRFFTWWGMEGGVEKMESWRAK